LNHDQSSLASFALHGQLLKRINYPSVNLVKVTNGVLMSFRRRAVHKKPCNYVLKMFKDIKIVSCQGAMKLAPTRSCLEMIN
jgi:hypothetical protein